MSGENIAKHHWTIVCWMAVETKKRKQVKVEPRKNVAESPGRSRDRLWVVGKPHQMTGTVQLWETRETTNKERGQGDLVVERGCTGKKVSQEKVIVGEVKIDRSSGMLDIQQRERWQRQSKKVIVSFM